MRAHFFLLFLFALPTGASAGVYLPSSALDTPTYRISIAETCQEHAVGDCTATYVGQNKKTGKSIRLKGAAVMAICKDEATPCHLESYKFIRGAYTYFVYPSGDFFVKKGKSVLVQEHGVWGT